MFSDLAAFQVVGSFAPSATPFALTPRNEGQCCAVVVTQQKVRQSHRVRLRFITTVLWVCNDSLWSRSCSRFRRRSCCCFRWGGCCWFGRSGNWLLHRRG